MRAVSPPLIERKRLRISAQAFLLFGPSAGAIRPRMASPSRGGLKTVGRTGWNSK